MEIIKRNYSILENNNRLKEKYNFKNFPIRSGCEISLDNSKDYFEDMKWGVSKDGLIQLMNLIPLDVLYSNYHNAGSVGNMWENHHKNFAEFIRKKNLVRFWK